jgi:hypothetical protein
MYNKKGPINLGPHFSLVGIFGWGGKRLSVSVGKIKVYRLGNDFTFRFPRLIVFIQYVV